MILQGWSFVGLKLLAGAHAGGAALQPVLAGQYLSGHPEALAFHALLGETIGWMAIGQALLALLCWWNGSLRIWAAAVLVLIFAMDGLQIHAGYAKSLDLHIPLGAGILAVSFAMTFWVWRQTLLHRA
jgi:hypothetical protein